mmetsp:Transcript_27363/g.49334  ORF Transcript_27363/g.49334 Transcript_27363/m.49334 type:complete len:106 (-) Transcript_27363:178-495(-)
MPSRKRNVGRARRINARGRQQQLLLGQTQQHIHRCMHGRPPSPSAAQKHILLNFNDMFKDVFKETVRKEGPEHSYIRASMIAMAGQTSPRKCKVSVFVHGNELSS